MNTKLYILLMTAISMSLLTLGFIIEGYISSIALILGGTYFGHILTEALNNPTEESL